MDGTARRWNTGLQVEIRREKGRVEGQAVEMGRRKLVIDRRKLSGAGRWLRCESGR